MWKQLFEVRNCILSKIALAHIKADTLFYLIWIKVRRLEGFNDGRMPQKSRNKLLPFSKKNNRAQGNNPVIKEPPLPKMQIGSPLYQNRVSSMPVRGAWPGRVRAFFSFSRKTIKLHKSLYELVAI